MGNVVRIFEGAPDTVVATRFLWGNERTVFLSGVIHNMTLDNTPEGPWIAGEDICLQLLYLDKEGVDPIKLVINSPGGDLDDGSMIVDTIAGLRSPLWTYVFKCASFATIIATLGEKGHRYILPSSKCLLHGYSGVVGGKRADMQAVSEYYEYKWRKLVDILTAHTKLSELEEIQTGAAALMKTPRKKTPSRTQDEDEVEKRPLSKERALRQAVTDWLDKQDRLLTAEEAVEYGIVDEVVTPEIQRMFFNIT